MVIVRFWREMHSYAKIGVAASQSDASLYCLRQAGRLKILYIAPERLHNETLLRAMQPLFPLPLLVVDGELAMAVTPEYNQ